MADTNRSDGGAQQDNLLEEASLWFARMRGPASDSHREALDAWLNRSAAHLGAYNRASEIFAMGKIFLRPSPNKAAVRILGSGRLGRSLVTVLGAVIVVTLAVWLLLPTASSRLNQIAATVTGSMAQTRYASAKERRMIRLADGSVVTLNPGSVLVAAFGASERELNLESGSARFNVAHESRPFIVRAGGGSVTARGTIFEVAVTSPHGIVVRLLRGAVDVERPALAVTSIADTKAITRLTPGESMSFGGIPPLEAIASLDSLGSVSVYKINAPAAREFENASLASVIAEANRGAATPIRLADPAIGRLKVSGRFRIDNTAQVAVRLADLFALGVDQSQPNQIILRTPRTTM